MSLLRLTQPPWYRELIKFLLQQLRTRVGVVSYQYGWLDKEGDHEWRDLHRLQCGQYSCALLGCDLGAAYQISVDLDLLDLLHVRHDSSLTCSPIRSRS